MESFFASHSALAWSPGAIDCCLFLADWAVFLGHPDPADHLRGTYEDEEGFRGIVEAAGGLVPVVGFCVEKIRGKRVQRPAAGDIGVIGSPKSIHRQWGAIFDGARWNIRFENAIGPMTASPLAIWSIPKCRD
ncbi:DUF6950 family protein [Rhizobium sp. 768_B6_N1_8]|uniref:DUF6950 family protein n=1 Tax=unclassified Rhizobium TaxID=2613769 RepID=UPI003F225DA3